MATAPSGQSILARTIFACCALFSITLLGIFDVLDSDAVTALVTLMIGYVLGNGVLMTKNRRDS